MLPKIGFFGWTASLANILMLDNLRKRGLIVMDLCYVCKKSEELVDLLLPQCEVARMLWVVIFNRMGFVWVIPKRVIDLFSC